MTWVDDFLASAARPAEIPGGGLVGGWVVVGYRYVGGVNAYFYYGRTATVREIGLGNSGEFRAVSHKNPLP